jgi:threonine/homoserine/homoserine lactone efflux protein
MPLETLATLTLFAFVGSVTPGPNNIMVMVSAANFGLRRTVPHMLGIAIGFGLMIFLTGLGLSEIFRIWPPSLTLLRWTSVVYLIYLAWKLATAAPPKRGTGGGRPLGFVGAALFQWVNPKAWTLAIATIGAYLPDPAPASALIAASVFALVGLPSNLIWAKVGEALRHLLADRRRLRIFNAGMACLLLASLWPILRG